jgi:hypothetical protein
MTDRQVDADLMVERYLKHALAPEERATFEAHLVDCQECMDRLLLAEMFHARNGFSRGQAERDPAGNEPLPFRARFAAYLKPWQLLLIFVIAVALLLAIPTLAFLWVPSGR